MDGREVAAQLKMILAQRYLARYGTCFDAYMALQRALMQRYLTRGGTKEVWCERFAPVFRERYWPVFVRLDCPDAAVISSL
jgi:hypothetical protein